MSDLVTWTDERIEQLRKLWDQGLSASAIGKQLGVSKNAVVGKAHRLKLPARPSPIRKGSRPPVRRMAVLPKPLATPMARQAAPGQTAERAAPAPAKPSPAPAPASVGRAAAPAVGRRGAAARGVKSCLWPIGDPGTNDFHFCGGEVVPGKSYCADHCAKAYISKSRSDSEAA